MKAALKGGFFRYEELIICIIKTVVTVVTVATVVTKTIA